MIKHDEAKCTGWMNLLTLILGMMIVWLPLDPVWLRWMKILFDIGVAMLLTTLLLSLLACSDSVLVINNGPFTFLVFYIVATESFLSEQRSKMVLQTSKSM